MKLVVMPIRVGHRVWCGLSVTILASVTSDDDGVIAAGAPALPLPNLQRNPNDYDRSDWG